MHRLHLHAPGAEPSTVELGLRDAKVLLGEVGQSFESIFAARAYLLKHGYTMPINSAAAKRDGVPAEIIAAVEAFDRAEAVALFVCYTSGLGPAGAGLMLGEPEG